jgi:hypothetical protein
MDTIRGIECSLYNDQIGDLLRFLSNKTYEFYVSKCMKIESNNMLIPKATFNFPISSLGLKNLAQNSIWELVLHIYPLGLSNQVVETYDDFIRSSCICCLIFYDCGLLDIYVKDTTLRNQLYEQLLSLNADEIKLITASTDKRTSLGL